MSALRRGHDSRTSGAEVIVAETVAVVLLSAVLWHWFLDAVDFEIRKRRIWRNVKREITKEQS